MNDEIECAKCLWVGTPDELICSEEDTTRFNRCPRCGGEDFDDLEEELSL